MVVVEALVLGRQDRQLDELGDLVDEDRLGVAAVVEFGQELSVLGIHPRHPRQVGKRERQGCRHRAHTRP